MMRILILFLWTVVYIPVTFLEVEAKGRHKIERYDKEAEYQSDRNSPVIEYTLIRNESPVNRKRSVFLRGDNFIRITNLNDGSISYFCENIQEIFLQNGEYIGRNTNHESLKQFQFLKLILRRRKERTKNGGNRKTCCAIPKSLSIVVSNVQVLEVVDRYLRELSSLCDIIYVVDSFGSHKVNTGITNGSHRRKRDVSSDKKGHTEERTESVRFVLTKRVAYRPETDIVSKQNLGMQPKFKSSDLKKFQDRMSVAFSKQPVWAMMCVTFIILLTMFLVLWTGIFDNCKKNREYLDYGDHLQLAYVKDVVKKKYEFLNLLRKWRRQRRKQRRRPRDVLNEDIDENSLFEQENEQCS